MTEKRDPRVDPRPGDLIRGDEGFLRRVLFVHGGSPLLQWSFVEEDLCEHGAAASRPFYDETLEEWRRKYATAEIVKVADAP